MSREESDEVPPPRSPLSTTAVRKPRSAASRAIPAPVTPPPMTRTSTGSAAIYARAAARVRCEKGVSLVDVLQLARQRARGRFRDFREENVMPVANGRRVAVIAGCRTPLCRSGTVLKDARAVDLARFVARELLERTNLDGAEVNAVIFGQVVS